MQGQPPPPIFSVPEGFFRKAKAPTLVNLSNNLQKGFESSCEKHIWKFKNVPVPCPGYFDKKAERLSRWFYYECIHCGKEVTSSIKIKTSMDDDCEHNFQSDPILGSEYQKYVKCLKCGIQRINGGF